MPDEGLTPVAPVLYPRAGSGLWAPILEEGEERRLGVDGDDAVCVEPDALEDETEELSLGGGLCLFFSEHGEVFEHLLGVVEVGERLRCER